MESNHVRLVDVIMIGYGEWCNTNSGMVNGYPHATPFRQKLGGSIRGQGITEDAADKVSSAMRQLRRTFPDQESALNDHYVKRKSKSQIGRERGMGSTETRHFFIRCLNSIELLLDPDLIY